MGASRCALIAQKKDELIGYNQQRQAEIDAANILEERRKLDAKRVADEAVQEAKERAEYERLQKKYGDSVKA